MLTLCAFSVTARRRLMMAMLERPGAVPDCGGPPEKRGGDGRKEQLCVSYVTV